MRSIMIGNIELGKGYPKICVPITARTEEELLQDAARMAALEEVQIVEWRADWYLEGCVLGQIGEILDLLKAVLDRKPVLVTYRTAKEGGEHELSEKDYQAFVEEAIMAGADAVDIELSSGEDTVRKLTEKARMKGTVSVVSSHFFHETPPTEAMLSILRKQQELGAEICKLAVMPACPMDTIRLLEATARRKEEAPDSILITMSMGKLGAVSRICGELTGSCLTFGTVTKASALGQIEAKILPEFLKRLSLNGF